VWGEAIAIAVKILEKAGNNLHPATPNSINEKKPEIIQIVRAFKQRSTNHLCKNKAAIVL